MTTPPPHSPDGPHIDASSIVEHFLRDQRMPFITPFPRELLDLNVVVAVYTHESLSDEQKRNLERQMQERDARLSADKRADTPQPFIPVVSLASTVVDAVKAESDVFMPTINSRHALGSRPDYRLLFAFGTEEECDATFSDLDSITHVTIPFERLIGDCVSGDIGFVFQSASAAVIIEPDRINEYARASFTRQHYIPKQDDITDVGPHTLRPEEFGQLLTLIQRAAPYVETWEVASAQCNGGHVNLLTVVAKPTVDPDTLSTLCNELSRAASEIKTPFLVAGSMHPRPVRPDLTETYAAPPSRPDEMGRY